MKWIWVLVVLELLWSGPAMADDRIRSDGMGGYYTDKGRYRSDRMGGFYTPDGGRLRSDGMGGFYQSDGMTVSPGHDRSMEDSERSTRPAARPPSFGED